MGFFGFGKKDRVIDLSEGYRRKEIPRGQSKEEPSDSFSILGSLASGSSQDSSQSSGEGEFSGSTEENRKKLAKRLLDITNKLDEISTQIYHLQQRVELLERKAGVKAGI